MKTYAELRADVIDKATKDESFRALLLRSEGGGEGSHRP